MVNLCTFQFYGFKEAPFQLHPRLQVSLPQPPHQEALAALLFGVQERKASICLTGRDRLRQDQRCAGPCSASSTRTGPDVRRCSFAYSQRTWNCSKTINEGFGLPAESDSKKALLDTLNNYLIEEFSKRTQRGLLISTRRRIWPRDLEQIRIDQQPWRPRRPN